MADVEFIKSKLRVIPDFPKKDPLAVEALVTHIVQHILSSGEKVDAIVGLDARGFLIGPTIAMRLGAAFVPVRKAGKLPGECIKVSYEKEYGTDFFEVQVGSIKPGAKIVVIDDLVATGGSAKAAGELVKKSGGSVVEYVFFIELTFLKGNAVLDAPSYSVIKLDD
ncbi:adenine phosphoribosyltransferase [Nowakowskiella sp. JEL0078]|nr:adenine phosphoribosyltransferase [Nowakowskiella sp. JEL0078]